MYVPFMIAWPQSVYPYAFVVMLVLVPMLCHLWENSQARWERNILVILAIGVALSQWQAYALYNLTGNDLAHAVPGLGLLITMAGISAYKLMDLRRWSGQTAMPAPKP
jgi:hypothetical protein